jgi:hypothetical protein
MKETLGYPVHLFLPPKSLDVDIPKNHFFIMEKTTMNFTVTFPSPAWWGRGDLHTGQVVISPNFSRKLPSIFEAKFDTQTNYA